MRSLRSLSSLKFQGARFYSPRIWTYSIPPSRQASRTMSRGDVGSRGVMGLHSGIRRFQSVGADIVECNPTRDLHGRDRHGVRQVPEGNCCRDASPVRGRARRLALDWSGSARAPTLWTRSPCRKSSYAHAIRQPEALRQTCQPTPQTNSRPLPISVVCGAVSHPGRMHAMSTHRKNMSPNKGADETSLFLSGDERRLRRARCHPDEICPEQAGRNPRRHQGLR